MSTFKRVEQPWAGRPTQASSTTRMPGFGGTTSLHGLGIMQIRVARLRCWLYLSRTAPIAGVYYASGANAGFGFSNLDYTVRVGWRGCQPQREKSLPQNRQLSQNKGGNGQQIWP